MTWKYIKGTKRKYQINKSGHVRNSQTKRLLKHDNKTIFSVGHTHLFINNKITSRSISRLLVDHFPPKEKITESIIKKQLGYNDYRKNLEGVTQSEFLLRVHRKYKKKRGVYYDNCHKLFKVVLKINLKSVTVGYFKEKNEANKMYYNTYKEWFGIPPY